MSSQWKAVLGVILIFLFGWASGALCTTLFFAHRTEELIKRGPETVVDLLERRLTRNLHLDADQQQQIHGLFMENVNERRELQRQIQPEVQRLNWQTFRQISAILRPEQRQILRQNLETFRQRFGKYALNPNADSPQTTEPPADNTEGSSATNGT
jgi:hypothetical protein